MADALILSGSHGWTATPWDYSSLRFLQFRADGSGELMYGYGQSIYAKIKCNWELSVPGILHLTYLVSAPHQRFQGFTPSEDNYSKDLVYKLTEGEYTGIENIIGKPYSFLWMLEVDQSVWPEGVELRYEVPRVFYGHLRRETQCRPV